MIRKSGFILGLFSLLLLAADGFGQGRLPGRLGQLGNIGRGGSGGGADSLERRTGLEDSVTISYRLLDSTRLFRLDTSISDFSKRYPTPASYTNLGNLGSPTRSITFDPFLKPGFDAGFHALDLYKFTVEETKFYNTTRPFSELAYVLGGRSEQSISLLHTQNIKPNWNFAFQYRMFNAPGFFQNQNTNHNNYRFNSFYQSKDKRYGLYMVILSNILKASENGGIANDQDYLNDVRYSDRFNIPSKLGGQTSLSSNLFSSSVNTGNLYNNSSFYLRQQYDWGKKDSLQVNDSTVVKLYYPKFRVQHTIQANSSRYRYIDTRATDGADFYTNAYQFIPLQDTLQIRDQWKELRNEIAVYQFPDTKNQQQFLRIGGVLQNLTGTLRAERLEIYNIILNGEYRNKTRNQKWDIEANGQLYATGFNAGDYQAMARLKRFLGKKLGYLELGFQNINRTPSFIFDSRSSFNFTGASNFNKENITHAFAQLDIPGLKLDLTGHLYLIGNYTYFADFYHPQQAGSVFNVLKITGDKKFDVSKYWKWYAHVTVQQKTGAGPVNIPLVFTRNRFAFEGNFFKNLYLSTGLELRYATPYKAAGYSPMIGQFYYQDTETIKNMPDLAAFFHFRIKTFNAFIRTENLNALSFQPQFGFLNNSQQLPGGYVNPGMMIRIGIFWGFVN